MEKLQINASRLWDSLHTMARIGATPRGGVTRPGLSEEDKQARDLFCEWLRAAALEVKIDDVGNIFGWRKGEEPHLPPILIGSHLDSVPNGGKYDGSLGTLAALEVVRTLFETKTRTRRTVGVVAFTAEEGARFEPAILGPSVIAGRFTIGYVYSRRDVHSGASFGEELERIGYKGEAANRPPRLRAFLELHIEQGPQLDQEQLQIGVVEGIVGIKWFEIRFHGEANHAGTTPMAARRDALSGAAKFIGEIRNTARMLGGTALATVGRLRIEPDVINVVPGQAVIGLDIRHADPGVLDKYGDMVRSFVESIAKNEHLDCSYNEVQFLPVTKFDASLALLVEDAARTHGLTYKRMVSGAGHDSLWMARFCPTTMIFVPCKLGKSHCEDEEIGCQQAVAGASVLATVVSRLAQESGSSVL